MRERVEDRHERILRIVRDRGVLRVKELAEEIGTSLETIRRDVTALSDVGRLRRVHGKVYWPTAQLNARDARLERQVQSGSREPVLGMVVPVAGYFYGGIIHGARAAAAAAGARLTVAITDYVEEREARQIETMVKNRVDGLMFTPSGGLTGPAATDWDLIESLDVPTVLVERHIAPGRPGATLDRVGSDHVEGAALAVRHLTGLGHDRIALLSRPTHTSEYARAGYHAAIAALGLPEYDLSRAGVASDPHSHGHLEADVARLIELYEQQGVRAALVHTDADATNLLQVLASRGVRVPEDFALVAYDDELAAIADVPLTAVAPPKQAIGEAAANLLLRRITDPTAPRNHLELLPELRIRASCGAPADSARPSRR